jgi:hypothetical protein
MGKREASIENERTEIPLPWVNPSFGGLSSAIDDQTILENQ